MSIPNPPNAPAGYVPQWTGSEWKTIPIPDDGVVPAMPTKLPEGYTADWNGSSWVVNPPPPPPPEPTDAEVTLNTLNTSVGKLQNITFLTDPYVTPKLTDESAAAVEAYTNAVADIAANAQYLLQQETVVRYEPEFPPAPIVVPTVSGVSADAGSHFLVRFKHASPAPDPKPVKDPVTGGKKQVMPDGYTYHAFESNEDVVVSADVLADVLVIGGGGAGHGQTLTMGQGGDGGGGGYEYNSVTLTAGTHKAVIGQGGSQKGDAPDGGLSSFFGIAAFGGATATGKNSEVGTADHEVPDGFKETYYFCWNKPMSYHCCGVAKWDKSNQPSGVLYGQAGGGTNNSAPGVGKQGIVVLRYKTV